MVIDDQPIILKSQNIPMFLCRGGNMDLLDSKIKHAKSKLVKYQAFEYMCVFVGPYCNFFLLLSSCPASNRSCNHEGF